MGSFLARQRRCTAVSCAAFVVSAAPLAAAGDTLDFPTDRLLAVIDASVEPSQGTQHHVRIEGTVLLPDGAPARGAVVVSSAGGSVAVGDDGSFSLEVAVAPAALAVELTAVAAGPRGTLIARRWLDGLREGPARRAGTLLLTQSGGCIPDWVSKFGGSPGTNGEVRALTVFDDGSGAGPALYAGGHFTKAGGQTVNYIAKWDGESWSSLGPGMNSWVYALTVFDDGSGAALYAGGHFTSAGGQLARGIAKWDSQGWTALGTGTNGAVAALTVFDDGSGAGPALYAGGWFTSAGGQGASRIARWDGQSWSALGSGVSSPWPSSVAALAAFDDGSGAGPALYAGGNFTSAGGQGANYIAKWDGQGWSALGSGTNAEIYALAVFDDGSGAGPALHAGGWFTSAGGQGANKIARWAGQAWSGLSSGMNDEVHALTVFDDGSGAGPALFAGGPFTSAGSQPANRIAKWDGQTWSALGTGLNSPVSALSVFDDGSGAGPALHAGGSFSGVGGLSRMAKWDGRGWSALGSGLNWIVNALAVYDDGAGAGSALYAGGEFTSAGGEVAGQIAKWDGQGWSLLGSGVDGWVYALIVYDDGSGAGPALYAGGIFSQAGGQDASNIARWDGQSWSALGTGLSGVVRSMTVFDDGSGSGPALYAGGLFTSAGGQPANRIAKWDGQSWSPLGSGLNDWVLTLTKFDDGSGAGPALYAGGAFTSSAGQPALWIARWDGQSWSALGDGVLGWVRALTVFDDGSGAGPALYAGGEFISGLGGEPGGRIAKWDGQGWSELGGGMNDSVFALTVFDDGSGSGPALYAGGEFTTAGGQAASRIAKWDGQSWSALGSGTINRVLALTGPDDGPGGAALYAGGEFGVSPGGDSFIAQWGCPESSIDPVPGCFGNPAVLKSLSSELAIGSTFTVSLSSSQIATGLGLLFFGADGTDAAGCGVFVPGIGELLLGLSAPLQLGSGPLSGGAVTFALPVPDAPSLVGIEAAFHGAVIGLFDPGLPIELSNGLLATVMP